MMQCSVSIGNLVLKNPVMAASGTFGYGREFGDFVTPEKLGAIVTKTITLKRRDGNRPPRLCETASGVLNAIGLQNEGLDDFIQNKIPLLKNLKTNLIVSVGGESHGEYVAIIKALSGFSEVGGFELNISCPNIECRDKVIAQDEDLTRRLVEEARQATSKALIIKLSPGVSDITKIAKAAQDSGADAVSLINTLLGMAIDVTRRRPVLGNITGGLSGPAIKPIALRMVWQVRNKVTLPIIGMGGIMSGRDAVEFLLAGATAVAVGTANFVDPCVMLKIIEDIKAYGARHKVKDVKELIGGLNVG
jgi:dihydroorotate dehydrogenase (NAD+) catalytic subunit